MPPRKPNKRPRQARKRQPLVRLARNSAAPSELDSQPLNHLAFRMLHNSYVSPGFPNQAHKFKQFLSATYALGTRGYEFDLHYGESTDGWSIGHDLDEYHLEAEVGPYLAALAEWSEDNAGHDPIILQLEPKTAPRAHFAERFDGYLEECGALPSVLYRPVDFIGRARRASRSLVAKATLADAIDAAGWPLLSDIRGKVLLTMSGGLEDLLNGYAQDIAERFCFPDRCVGVDSWYFNAPTGSAGNRVFLNMQMSSREALPTALKWAARDGHFMTRVYGIFRDFQWRQVREAGANILATDLQAETWCQFDDGPIALSLSHHAGRPAIA